MTKHLVSQYRKFRQAGYSAGDAFHSARTVIEWERLEAAGLVCLKAMPDDCADITSEETEAAERWGVWGVCGFYRTSPDLDEWATRDAYTFRAMERLGWADGDSIWNCIYDRPLDPRENCYVPDIMAGTIAELKAALKARAAVVRFSPRVSLVVESDYAMAA